MEIVVDELEQLETLYESEGETDETTVKRCRLPRRQTTVQSKKLCAKEERNASLKKVSSILQKMKTDRTFEENQVLLDCPDVVEEVQERWRKRDAAKKRIEEFEDPETELQKKCQILAQAIAQSQHLVVYTGAGISTAAKIPDYRGPNGIWTRLQQGKDIGDHDLTLAEPTYTHMALSELYRKNILKYIVSQNCDGLHLRSGLPKTALSELHGNMYIEVCTSCKPHKEYWRLFDVTENTARFAHKTLRKCYTCNEPLIDTIVHFGERGSLQWPLNWSGACKNAKLATTILCLGSSLKVLKKYPWLWQMDKPAKKRPNLYIVNLQWTPKDDVANIKINGKCDKVMRMIMQMLGLEVGDYRKSIDPIYSHATDLNTLELHTTSQPVLKICEMEKNEMANAAISAITAKDCNMALDLSRSCKAQKSIANCDNNGKSVSEHLPTPLNSAFSIDSLLSAPKLPQVTAPNYLNSFLNPGLSFFGYNLAFGGYTDFFLYPYQTSFLYPGLHSIINPLPPLSKEEHQNKKEEIEIKLEQPSCNFCKTQNGSYCCLFYVKAEPVFGNQQSRFSKIEGKDKANVCVCCDYSTDEEDPSDVNDSLGSDKDQSRVRIQAGWFGKGYKKCKRQKRKL